MRKLLYLFSALVFLLACTARPKDPLSIAAITGNLPEVTQLLQHASIDDRNLALVWAARSGQPEAIFLLVKSGADPNVRSGVNDWPVLMHAIHKDQPSAVSALLDSGANPNASGSRGETPLMMAAGYGYTEIALILLLHGANAHVTLKNGENALDRAITGVSDIDQFTWGTCQADTVRLLRQRVPDPANGPRQIEALFLAKFKPKSDRFGL